MKRAHGRGRFAIARVAVAALGVGAMVLGALAYARYRSEIAAEGWLARVGLGALPRALRAAAGALPPLPRALVDVLPDALFAFAVAVLLAVVWWTPPRARTFAVVAGGMFAAGYEVAQAAGVAPGTFDLADLVAAVLGAAAAWLLVRAIDRSTGRKSRARA